MTKEEIYEEILTESKELSDEEFELLIRSVQNKINEDISIAIIN
ncbi:MAG: hypothetical protein AB6733_11995 [Clostridiaceae bacterium]